MSGEEVCVHGARVSAVSELRSDAHDALVVLLVGGVSALGSVPRTLRPAVDDALRLDAALCQSGTAVVRCSEAAGDRLVVSSSGPLSAYDDVRSAYEAARAGVRRAHAAGARRPVLVLTALAQFPRGELVALLGALEALYVPLQVRETFPETARAARYEALGVWGVRAAPLVAEGAALELARGLARDVGGADPERMSPPRAADHLRAAFAGGPVRVRVLDDAALITREYPLFAAVSRAADAVPRHRGRIVFLEFVPERYDRTMMLVGKGVTYDTGGCDIKTGGAMAGMSRDKCGAAAVAGFVKACELLRAEVKVVAALALVRNSVGEEAYVADEVVRSRRGEAVRVGNTDAEGRMAMADLLAELAERAPSEREPHLYTVATLTGHAHRCVGDGYSVALDNAPAHAAAHADKLRAAGESLADMVEVSRMRREDLRAHAGRAAGDTLHQAESQPSTQVPRGHQGPAAFLLLAAGLRDSPLPYTHLDVAGSAGAPPHQPTAAPLLALAALAGLVRSC